MKTLLTFFCLAACTSIWAQTSITYFDDDYPKPEGGSIRHVIEMEDDFVIAGRFFDVAKHNPAVIRIDTLGNTLWTSSFFDDVEFEDNTLTAISVWDIIMDVDGWLYAMFVHDAGSDEIYWCYKINSESGEIAWKQQVSPEMEYLPSNIFLKNYNDTTIAISYKSSIYQDLKLLNKITGEIIFEFDFTDSYPSYAYRNQNVSFDETYHIYFPSKDTLYKASADDPDSIIWRTRIIDPYEDDIEDEKVEAITEVYFDDDGELFIMGSQGPAENEGYIAKMDAETGEMIWYSGSSNGWYRPAVYIDEGDYFYISWQHKVEGGGYFYYYIQKIRKSDGQEIWGEQYSMGDDIEDCYSGAAALAMDYDGEYIYATGYVRAQNFGPGIWGNIKVDAENGELIYEVDMETACVKFSSGNAVFIKDDIAYYLGQLTTGDDSYIFDHDLYLLKTDKISGDILASYPITGSYRFPSRTINITPYASGMVVLKQVGLRCELEKYNPDKSLAWKRVMKNNGCLYGDKLRIGDDMSIWVVGHGQQELTEDPYLTGINDSIFLFRYDTDGNLDENAALTTTHFPVDMEIAGDTAFIITSTSGNMYLRRYADGIFSSSVFLDNRPVVVPAFYFNLDFLYRSDENKIIFNGFIDDYDGIGAEVVEINNATLDKTVIDTVANIDYVHHILRINDSTVMLAGEYYPLTGPQSGTLVFYDNKNKDTVWTFISSSGAFTKCVSDPTGEYVFAFGISSYVSVPVYHLNKIRVEDGKEIWNRVYDIVSPLYGDYENADITYDVFNDLLVLAMNTDSAYGGFEYNKIPLVKVVDTSGLEIRHIRLEPNDVGNFRSITAQSWGDGVTWVGGNHSQLPYLRDGFILSFDTVYIYPGVEIDSCHAFFEYTTDASGTTYFTNLSTGMEGADIISYFWDFCDGSVSTDEDAIHVYAGGEVDCACLTIEDALGCSDMYCVGDVGIEEKETAIHIYPNPVNGNSFYIESSEHISFTGICDMAGRMIEFTTELNDSGLKVTLTNAAAGICYIRLASDAQQWTKKIVVIK